MSLIANLRGKGLRNRLLHPRDAVWDQRLGVQTFGFIPDVGDTTDADWQGHYSPTPYRDVFAVLKHAGLTAEDVVVDLGCGLGRVVFAANRLGARRAVGVEIDPKLHRQCLDSIRHGGYTADRVEFVCTPAQNFWHDDTTVLFMFHPFGSGTLRSVIEGLDAALDARPRPLRLIYVNPVHDDVIASSRHLEQVEHWPLRMPSSFVSHRYAVTFWRT